MKTKLMNLFILAPAAPGELKFMVGENAIADSPTIILWELMFSEPDTGSEAGGTPASSN